MAKLKMALAVILMVVSVTGAGITPARAGAVASVRPIQSSTQLAASINPSNYGVPDTLAGYKVLAVLTSDTEACMQPGKKHLILQSSQAGVEDFLKAVDSKAIDTALRQAGLTADEVEISVTGPGTTLDVMSSVLQKWNQLMTIGECQKSLPLKTGSDWTEIKSTSPSPGWAIFEDLDAGSYTNDNAQSVNMTAPTSIGNPPLAVSMLNNVQTDSPTFYFLQNGLLIYLGAGSVIWTDTSENYQSRTYPINYVAGHSYWFTISYTNGSWWMCAKDNGDPNTYTCRQETRGTGTTLAGSLNTNVFMENHNRTSNWYTGFSSPFQAWGAQIYRNGVGQNWASNHRHTVDSCVAYWPPSSALSGSLTGGGTGNFILSGVPLSCGVYADGYYDSAGGAYVFGGARSDMECANPQIRDGNGFSSMRVAVSHKMLSDPNPDHAFVEIGCMKYPSRFGDQSRHVYGSWVTTSGLYDDRIFSSLADGDYAAHDYRVAIKNDNPNVWSFIFDGVTRPETINPGFTRGAELYCGGVASTSQNAIGVAACWNVRYKNNDLTSWVYLPSHLKRVSTGYTVVDFSSYSWQSYGNN